MCASSTSTANGWPRSGSSVSEDRKSVSRDDLRRRSIKHFDPHLSNSARPNKIYALSLKNTLPVQRFPERRRGVSSVEYRLSKRTACKLLDVERSSYRYEPRQNRSAERRNDLVKLARQKLRYGYRRCMRC